MSVRSELLKIPRLPGTILKKVLPLDIQRLIAGPIKRALGKKYVLVACMPKSGSTYLTATLSNLDCYCLGLAVPSFERREQELDELTLLKYSRLNKHLVFHNHTSYSDHLKSLADSYPFHVVVLYRDLMDVCASISDHLANESTMMSMAYMDTQSLSSIDKRNQRLGFIVDCVMPWYINFWTSWNNHGLGPDQVTFLEYERLVGEPCETIHEVAKRVDPSINKERVQQALNKRKFTRKNKGVAGRGKQLFADAPELQEKLMSYCKYYPDIDFSPILKEL